MNKYNDIKKQAFLGELKAIEYFIMNDFDVYKQYTGKESIDLVVLKKDKIYRVECKSTSNRAKEGEAWIVKLFKSRSNKTTEMNISFNQWKSTVDLLSIYVEPIDYLLIFHKDEIKVGWNLTINDELIEVRNNDECFKYEILNNNVEKE
tara:strand:- start:30 stop:476 length:447 start_codon:yes stop_codon:yes gene_type:complete